MAVYAIVRSGGKQYRVQQGATIDVERLAAPEGGQVELAEVLLLDEDGHVTVGTPTVPGVKVMAEVVSHGRGPRLIVFRYRAKTRYRKKTGHRQAFTRLAIQKIQVGEEEKPAPRRRARKAAPAEPAVAEAAPEEPGPLSEAAAVPEEPATVSEAAAPEEQAKKKPAPRRRRKTAESPPTGE